MKNDRIKQRIKAFTLDMVAAFFIFSCQFFPKTDVLLAVADGQNTPLDGVKKQLLLATFSTTYSEENEERSSNIKRACKFLNGTVVSGMGTFSFNERVGKRTTERGFLSAPVILDGVYTQGVGGGVCQVSTTLYNAALLSGLTIQEAHAHTLLSSYVPPSQDAMVSSQSDLKFLNESKAPVVLFMKAENGTITAQIYGREKPFDYEVKSVTLSVVPQPAPVEEVGDKDEIVRKGHDGLKSESYLVKKRRGKVLSVRRIRRDRYAPVGEIRKVAPKKEDTDESTQDPHLDEQGGIIDENRSIF